MNLLPFFDDDLPAILPSPYRLLYKAPKFALWYLPDDICDDSGSCRRLALLSDVLYRLSWEYETILVQHP